MQLFISFKLAAISNLQLPGTDGSSPNLSTPNVTPNLFGGMTLQGLFVDIIVILAIVIGIPYAYAAVLTAINKSTKSKLASWNVYSQIFIGGLGTFIHELSHAIMCLIFGHRIDDMKLLKLNLNDDQEQDGNKGSLGYVNHSYNPHSVWQLIGNLWIGLAPIFGCALAILGLTYVLSPDTFHSWLSFAQAPYLSFREIEHLILIIIGYTKPLYLVIWFILVGMITIGGFDLSASDYKGTKVGIFVTAAVLIVITFLTASLGYYIPFRTALLKAFIPITIILSLTTIISIMYWAVISLVFVIFSKGRS